jgi:hypothetical protein
MKTAVPSSAHPSHQDSRLAGVVPGRSIWAGTATGRGAALGGGSAPALVARPDSDAAPGVGQVAGRLLVVGQAGASDGGTSEVEFVAAERLDQLNIHPSMRLRIDHYLERRSAPLHRLRRLAAQPMPGPIDRRLQQWPSPDYSSWPQDHAWNRPIPRVTTPTANKSAAR